MEVQAIAKSVRMSPRKVRLVADMIRHLSIDNALLALQATPKRAALPLVKTLKSAVANAVNNAGLDKNALIIESINISEGSSLKRFWPSTRGRIHPYKKRSSNIRIVLKAKESKATPKKTAEREGKEVKNLPAGGEKVKTKGEKKWGRK